MGTKKKYEERRANGICVKCGKTKAENGKVMCAGCLKKSMERTRERRQYLKQIGFCPECGSQKLVGVEKFCPECAAKKYASNRKSREGKPYDREYYREYARKKKAAGICVKCSRKAVTGKVLCGICAAKNAERGRVYRQSWIRRSERPLYGLCYFCGKPAQNNYRTCPECARRVAGNLPKYNPNEEWRQLNNAMFAEMKGEHERRTGCR